MKTNEPKAGMIEVTVEPKTPVSEPQTRIFNPYDPKSYDEVDREECFSEIKPIAIIKNRLIRSNGLFGDHYGKQVSDTIYVYHIPGETAVLQLQQLASYTPDRVKDNYIAFAFYDKELKRYLDLWEKDCERAIREEEYKTVYQMWHFGAVKRKTLPSESEWIKVPREIFSGVYDYVYLCICVEPHQKVPVLKRACFPKDRLFFYDLPVATSIHSGQTLQDSKILLGRIMGIGRIPNPDMKFKNFVLGYKTQDGTFKWASKDSTSKILIKNNVEVKSITKNCVFVSDEKSYECPPLEVFIYKKSPNERRKDITAFVWQSGNEDDEVKKAYLPGKDNTHSYNTYSYIMDSLSSHTMYRSMVSLTKFHAGNAARYAVRYLAKQPEGNRSFSIDGNNLVFLMGGALYKIESIMTNAAAEDKDRNLTDDEYSLVDKLYTINGSHLFFDNPVSYANTEQDEAQYYMQTVLGIKDGSNGCETIQQLLSSLFSEIKKHGIKLDYVYCDIEGPWNDIRALSARRFAQRFVALYPDSELEKAEGHVELTDMDQMSRKMRMFYDRVLINDIQKREDIWGEMLSRGFCLSEKILGDLYLARDIKDNDESLYGLTRYRLNYERRRTPNIWDAVMKEYGNDLFYKYVMQPVIKSNPKAKCSVFAHTQAKGYINHASRFETYLGGSVNLHPNMYSCQAIYGGQSGEYYKKLSMDNWKMFPNKRDLFTDFVGSINALRSALVSSQDESHPNGKFNVFISSFNIWVNNYINNAEENEREHIIEQIKEGGSLLKKLETYYKEFLFHAFLSCPDKAIAYFQVEERAIKQDLTIDNGGSYYFPFGNGQDFDSYKNYYSNSYSELQKILAELNLLIQGNACETTVRTLATETEPFVISGIKFANNALWRITWKDSGRVFKSSTQQNGISINTQYGSIMFPKGVQPSQKVSKSNFGMWILTPKDSEPVFNPNTNYFEENAAYVSQLADLDKIVASEMTSQDYQENKSVINMNEFAAIAGSLRYLHPRTHTLFGEPPRLITSSMKFRLNKEPNGFARLLWKYEENFELTIGKRKNIKDSLTVSTWTNSTTLKKRGTKKLTIGESYEVVKYIAFETVPNNSPVTCNIRFELWKLSKNGKRAQFVFADEKDFSYKNEEHFYGYESHSHLLSRDSNFMWNDITIEEFKFYFSQQHEKLELFRESDGVNVGRVNSSVVPYSHTVDTNCDDTLIGKLTWLNATNKPIVYNITFKLDGKEQVLDQKFATIKVNANSEGYVMIPLPPLNSSTKQAELTYEKQETHLLDTIGGEKTSFFMNHYNQYKTETVTAYIIQRTAED